MIFQDDVLPERLTCKIQMLYLEQIFTVTACAFETTSGKARKQHLNYRQCQLVSKSMIFLKI